MYRDSPQAPGGFGDRVSQIFRQLVRGSTASPGTVPPKADRLRVGDAVASYRFALGLWIEDNSHACAKFARGQDRKK